MIAPEGIRDGRYFAQALYTFAGEGVEDLPFKKGKCISMNSPQRTISDLIEVLDCGNDAATTEEAMKTVERLARLRDVLTPSYMKPVEQSSSAGDENAGAHRPHDPNSADSVESLLLNLANNEMQVQQQKIQAQMPRQPTRMKLLYEDHTQPGGVGRSASSLSTHRDTPQKQQQQQQQQPRSVDSRQPRPGNLASAHNTKHHDLSQNQAYSDRFSASIESMREATLRSEEASKGRGSGSMLFGPRGMPSSSSPRPSSRVHDPSLRSDNSTLHASYSASVQDAFGSSGNLSASYTSIYSQADAAGSVGLSAPIERQPSLSGARQLMEGIPSPTEVPQGTRHEAEYLFDDDEDDSYEPSEAGKIHSMISPQSESSANFMTYNSTVSSQSSSVSPSAAGSTRSKRLPAIPSSKNNSLISDASSIGLAGDSSVGDLTQMHRSWYSSTDSLNLQGGGGLHDATDDEGDDQDTYAPKAAKNKLRIRPIASSVQQQQPQSVHESPVQYSAESNDNVYSGNYDTRYDLASDFQRVLNISTNTHEYFGESAVDMQQQQQQQAASPVPPQHESQQQPVHAALQQHQHIPISQSPIMGYSAQGAYTPQLPNGFVPGLAHEGYQSPMQNAVDMNGRPYTVYQYPQFQPQQQYQQQQPFVHGQGPVVIAGGMAAGHNLQSPAVVNGYPVVHEQQQQQHGYYDPVQGAYITQQRSGSPAQYSPHSLRPVSSGASLSSGVVYSSQDTAVPNDTQLHTQADAFGRPRSFTTGTQVLGTPPVSSAQHGQMQPQHPAPKSANDQLVGGGGIAIPNQASQRASSISSSHRPASFAGTSARPDSSLASKPSARPQTPAEAGRPGTAQTPSRGPPTPTGTFSSAPSSTFTRRDGTMSPYPSNIGPSQANTLSNSAAYSSQMNTGAEHTESFVEDIDPQLTKPLPSGVTPINYVKMTRPVFKFGGHISHPEGMNWAKVDRQVAMIKSISLKLTAEVLATMHIGRPFNKPIERVRAAFVWIASNVQYDASAPDSAEEFEHSETPNMVIQRKRSRGPGFAYLFDAMMNALGIESHTVRGYLRQPLDSYQGTVLPEANHVWNAVCIDGEYRLVDTACAAKSHLLNLQSKTDAWFFMASPKELIFTHFPLAPGHQFVDPVVPLPVFWMLPYVRPSYFQCKVKLLNLPHIPRIEVKDDEVRPLVLCLRDSTLGVFAEVELHDANGSGRIVARQPLLAQCMDYKGKRMVKILVGVRGSDVHGFVKVYCGTRVPLLPRRPGEEAAPPSPGKAQKMLGFLHGKDKRTSAGDYTRIKDVDEEGNIKTIATSKTHPLACMLPIFHTGRPNAPSFVQPNAAIPNEFYIKEPTDADFRQGESINFHLLPVGDERLFHLQLRSPSGQQYKFVYQPSDQGYILRHTVKERGAWIIVYHTDTEGWLPIASYNCL
ncbi:hypothetical protein GGI12_001276 [Dipsacomyces acuminosporus]|nr:hypothetical protein GGI12_001276 [Dipsacomyces acuminosporus]